MSAPGPHGGAATWSSALEVFEQDFDTAMEIWMYQDPAVERLYCDEKRARRRTSVTGSQDASYQSQSQPRSQRPARKRRRRTVGADEVRADAPSPPLSLSPSCTPQPSQALDTTEQFVEMATPGQAEPTLTTYEGEAVPIVPGKRRGSAEAKRSRVERVPEIASKGNKTTHVAPDNEATMHRHSELDRVEPSYSSVADSDAERVGSIEQPPTDTTVAGLFQTGSGKNVRVSRARLHDYEEKLRHEDHAANVRGDGSAPSSASGGTAGGLVKAGEGESARVSAPRSTVHEESLKSDSKPDTNQASGPRSQTSAAPLPGTTIVSLFQTGSGKSVAVSTERLLVYRDKLSKDVLETPLNESGASETTVQSLLKTGPSRSTYTSESRLRDDELKHPDEETKPVDRDGDATGSSLDMRVSGLFQSGSGKNIRVSKARLLEYEAKLQESANATESAGRTSTADGTRNSHSGANGYSATSTVPSAVASLFHTGTGRNVRISESRLRDYEEKLQNDEVTNVLSVTSEGDAGVTGVAIAGRPVSMEESTVSSLFQTGSGKTVRIPKARLSEYASKMEKDSLMNETETSSIASAQEQVSATVESLFHTGLGKRVRVSEARLQDYEQKLCNENDARHGSFDSAVDRSPVRLQSVSSAPIPVPESSKTIVGLFQTGSEKSVRVSKERLRVYNEKLWEKQDTSEAHQQDAIVQDTGVVSLFQTGSGKSVRVSKERIRAYEDKLMEEDVRTDSVPPEIAERQAHSDTTVASLFQTGSGTSVRVSKERLREFESKLRDDAEATGYTDLENQGIKKAVDCESVNRAVQSQHSSEVQGSGDHSADADTKNAPTLDQQSAGQRSLFAQRPTLTSMRTPSTSTPSSGTAPQTQWRQRPPKPLPRAPLRGTASQFDKENQVADKTPVHGDDVAEAKLALLKSHLNPSSSLPKAAQKQAAVRVIPRPQSKGTQSLRQVGDKRKFHPPVLKSPDAVANQRVAAPPMSPQSSSMTRPKKPRLDSSPELTANAFRFKEIMKVPFAVLQDMQLSSGDALQLDGDCSLSSVTAATATLVVFPRGDCSSAVGAFYARSSLDEPYDPNAFMGLQEMYNHMMSAGLLELPAVAARTSNRATLEWFANHFRWIVWKLASMERAFPRFLLGKYLTKDQVMYQISRRYQRDVVAAQRSVLKKVLNRDSSSLSCMVLCIASVLPFPKRSDDPLELPDHWQVALVLTDGWYAVYAVPDAPLAAALWRAHTKSSIVGTKIAVWNSALRNSTEGIDPLECAITRGDCNSSAPWKNPLLVTDSEELTQWPYLELHYNSTRRVQFGERLGAEQLRMVSSAGSGGNCKPQRHMDFSLLKSVPLRSLVVDGGMVRSVRVVVKRISPVLHLQGKEWAIGPRILCADQMDRYFEMRSRLQQSQDEGGDIPDYDSRAASDTLIPIPFIKLEVECGHIKREDSDAVNCAFLTVWRPGDELLSGAVREGDEYFVSSLTVGWKIDGDRLRGGGAFLRLSSTKGTTFEKIEHQGTTGDRSSVSVCVNIADATGQYHRDESSGRIIRERRPAIDVCVYVLSVLAKEELAPSRPHKASANNKQGSASSDASRTLGNRELLSKAFMQHAFVTDGSHGLMCVRIPSTEVSISHAHSRSGASNKFRSARSSSSSATFAFRRGGASTWREGSVVCLRGLEISHYDDRLGVLDCLVAEGTQIVTFPSTKSHFSGAFVALQRAVKEGSGEFLAGAAKLRRYVDRRILGIDIAPSQESVAHQDEEADRLTQDLMSQHENENAFEATAPFAATAERPDLVLAMETNEVWEGRIARVLPVPVGPSHACDAGMVALLVVSLTGSDSGSGSAYKAVYVSAAHLCEVREALSNAANGVDERRGDALSVSEPRSPRKLVHDVDRSIREQDADATNQSGGVVLRFEVRRVTSERLLNSWKPWERESTVYWAVTSIQRPNGTGTSP